MELRQCQEPIDQLTRVDTNKNVTEAKPEEATRPRTRRSAPNDYGYSPALLIKALLKDLLREGLTSAEIVIPRGVVGAEEIIKPTVSVTVNEWPGAF
jgi:hypothetical protein